MKRESFSSDKDKAPLRDRFRTVQTCFHPFYLLDPVLEADLPGTLAKRPVRTRRGRTQQETRRAVSQQLYLLFQQREESLSASWKQVGPWWTLVTGR